ncbi:hypothetical protein LCGC14_0143180 [marine sediment metagenome]|uniref:Uncharacterized protein n=1 Tax=marine sediment metagenome TaxID=412755 RepID=A0A0F9XIM4_9ZZZZ
MIQKNEFIYHEEGEFYYVTSEMVKKAHTEQEAKDFHEWMGGQTCGMTPDGEMAIYSWDYERWCRQGKRTEQCSYDWD